MLINSSGAYWLNKGRAYRIADSVQTAQAFIREEAKHRTIDTVIIFRQQGVEEAYWMCDGYTDLEECYSSFPGLRPIEGTIYSYHPDGEFRPYWNIHNGVLDAAFEN